ncbi:MAG: type III PLP-dependent enzyme [Alphaproteobacteria bacterium]|nr:type III PLP-dependent enzyme [Alphaproteobacteria bacterium]
MTTKFPRGNALPKLYQEVSFNKERDTDVAAYIATARPSRPIHMMWPHKLRERANMFLKGFPGQTMYAVKVNPDETVIKTLYAAGISRFDVASIEEIRTLSRLAPKAKLYFMHPVKSRKTIEEAYKKYGVRAFSLDSEQELHKILAATDLAADLELFVRIALPESGKVALPMSRKFGAHTDELPDLLRKCRAVCSSLGVAFHVGFQCLAPEQYAKAIHLVKKAVDKSGVNLNAVDVGGGFPTEFPDMLPPPLEKYFDAIREALRQTGLDKLEVLCEPGQGLAASSGKLITQVELCNRGIIYLNDGVYGGLRDAGKGVSMKYPVQAVRPEGGLSAITAPFRLVGPTCDTVDMLTGTYELPENIDEGDWIVFGNTGAYSQALRSDFNGFGAADIVYMPDKGE